MKNNTTSQQQRLSKKLDNEAIHQLRAEVVRLHEENEDLRRQLIWAEDDATWARDQLNSIGDQINNSGLAMGITRGADLVVIAN